MVSSHTQKLAKSSKPLPVPMHLFERLFVRLLRRLHSGSLRIEFPSGAVCVVGESALAQVDIKILKARFFSKVLCGGSVGLGESYVQGLWTTPDLSAVLKLFACNQKNVGGLRKGFSAFNQVKNRFGHLARRNTRSKSRQNIQEHYDLSNSFYQLFLDSSMTYSSALFSHYHEDLEKAQLNKIDRMLDLSGIQEGEHLLEIGTGWGALALRAAQRGCKVTTITLSKEQFVFAQERFEKAGFSDMIELRLQDYRDLEGQFDGIVSCEMIEAVGKEYLPSYFNTIRNCLRQGANAVLQAITINDDRYDHYCRSCDWIQKHIFPGGHLPSLGAVTDHVLAAGDTSVVYVYSFGHHYAETLRRWFSSFNNRLAQLKSLGFDEKFQRKWNYYLSYCEAGFDADLIDVKHIVINRS